MSSAIRLIGVTKVYGEGAPPAVDSLDLEVQRGEIVALIGPSGCGKTTTLRMINRLVEPTAGTIEIDGVDVTGLDPVLLRRGIGYVIQQVGLFPHRSIAQNIATVPRALGWDRARTRDRVAELVELVGLDPELLDRYPDELSGGQQQRVGVARALAADPPVLLMDEPFGAVDPIVRQRLQEELLSLHRKVETTIVLVTHDLDEAIRLADRVAVLNVGGILEQFDTPDEVLRRPATAFVEEFVGADRAMRRLRLHTVADLPFEQGPVLDVGSSVSDAVALMDLYASNWVGVTVEGAFGGWVHRDALDADTLRDVPRALPAAQVTPRSTLHRAVELIMDSDTSVAVVDDDGRFGGVVTLEHVRRSLAGETSGPS